MYDAIVIGAGPAGNNFAYHASQKGLSIILLERRKLDDKKCCAGGLPLRALKEIKVPDEIVEREIKGFRIIAPDYNEVEIDCERMVGVTVDRTQFDKWMLERSEKTGAQLLRCAVKSVKFDNKGVRVDTNDGRELRSSVMIGAFGCSDLLNQITNIRNDFLVGVQVEIPIDENDISNSIGNMLEFYFDSNYTKNGYVWIFPKKEKVSVGMADVIGGQGTAKTLLRFIRSHQIASRKLNASKVLNVDDLNFEAALIPRHIIRKTYGDNFLLVGDAAGLVDQSSGEGIFFALKSGQIAVECLDKISYGDDYSSKVLSTYETMWKNSFGKELESGERVKDLIFGDRMNRTLPFLVSELKKNDSLMSFLIEQISAGSSIAEILVNLPLMEKMRLLARYKIGS